MDIAIVFCCYNRKDMTQRCLRQLFQQINNLQVHTFEIYVCDDNSTDGTREMIKEIFRGVKLVQSEGNQYWCKSMYKGMLEATKNDYDLYLMINDDVSFFSNALQIMLESYEKAQRACAIVGATKLFEKNIVSYGGRGKNGDLMIPNGELIECEWANWNCFLIDREVKNKVGIIDGKYQHSWGDFDYSFRMRKKKYPIYVATDFVGVCDTNSIDGTFRDRNLPVMARLKKLFGPKGLPFYSYMRYHMRVFGKRKIIVWFLGYVSIIYYIIKGKEIT